MIITTQLVESPAGATVAAEPAVSCDACIVVAAGEVVWSRDAHARLPNASTTKMVTALVTVERAELRKTVLVSDTAAATPGGGLELFAGDRYSVRDLLYALLLSSSNDAAVALAEHVAGSETSFLKLMNRQVRVLGANDTHFVTSHGLDVSGHFSSAADLALIGDRVLQQPVLARIVAARRATIGRRGEAPFELANRNELLATYRGAIGIKTGQTSGAGEVLVAAAERSDRVVIAVAMRSEDAAADARLLLDYGFAHFPDQSDAPAQFGRIWASVLQVVGRLLAAVLGFT